MNLTPSPAAGSEELQKKLQQDIRDMFKLEAQRNELNFALSGVERGEMTIQDYEDDLSLAISNYFVYDILTAQNDATYAKVMETLNGLEIDHYVLNDVRQSITKIFGKADAKPE